MRPHEEKRFGYCIREEEGVRVQDQDELSG
jgi:hypothetical protein